MLIKQGFIKNIRKSKDITFLTCSYLGEEYQLVVQDEALIEGVTTGSSFEAIVNVVQFEDKQDFVVKSIKLYPVLEDSYKIQPKKLELDMLRTIPEQRGRTKTFQNVWKLRHKVTQLIHKFFDEKGYYLYNTPIITESDCEGAGETFEIKTDWLEANLTVSGQLHLEVGMQSLHNVYNLSPCFRAEKSTGKRHLSEFWMLEVESAFKTRQDLIELCKQLLLYVCNECGYKLEEFQFKIITYKEVIEKYQLQFGDDIPHTVEQKLTENGDFVFIVDYPTSLKPFYMKANGDIVNNFDLIVPKVGELIGGSEREEDYELIKSKMIQHQLDLNKMEYYLATRRFGTVPHGGFGLGFERLLLLISNNLSHISDTIPFPIKYN